MPGLEAAQLPSPPADEKPGVASTWSPSRKSERVFHPPTNEDRLSTKSSMRSSRNAVRLSVLLTVHDGHVVEIQKTERIRKGLAKATVAGTASLTAGDRPTPIPGRRRGK